jgi:hypothetical protein
VSPQSEPVDFDGVAGGIDPGLPRDDREGCLGSVDEPARGGNERAGHRARVEASADKLIDRWGDVLDRLGSA